MKVENTSFYHEHVVIAGVQGAYAARSDGPSSTAVGVYAVVAHDTAASMCTLVLQ